VKLPPGVRALERDQELVAARGGIADGQDHSSRASRDSSSVLPLTDCSS
jgi:hypothetical protein